MKNWSVDTKELRKDSEKYTIWRLEQMINFGLDNEKIKTKDLKKYWPKLYIDPLKKQYLKLLLWPKQS